MPITLMIFTFFLILVFLAIFRPYKGKIENMMGIFNSVIYIVVLLMFLVLHLVRKLISEKIKYQIFGHLIIFFLGTIVIINIGISIV